MGKRTATAGTYRRDRSEARTQEAAPAQDRTPGRRQAEPRPLNGAERVALAASLGLLAAAVLSLWSRS